MDDEEYTYTVGAKLGPRNSNAGQFSGRLGINWEKAVVNGAHKLRGIAL